MPRQAYPKRRHSSPKEEVQQETFYIGIDPGKSGGIAVLNQEGEVLEVCHLEKEKDSLALLKQYGNKLPLYNSSSRQVFSNPRIILEWVHASPNYRTDHTGGEFQMGVKQAFGMGEAFGWIKGTLNALDLPYELVTPKDWQGYMKCLTGGDKNVTKRKAERLFPHAHVVGWSADALLIAEYNRRINT